MKQAVKKPDEGTKVAVRPSTGTARAKDELMRQSVDYYHEDTKVISTDEPELDEDQEIDAECRANPTTQQSSFHTLALH